MNSTDSRCQRWAKRASAGLTLGLAGERLQVARSITESDLVWDGVAGIKGRVLFDGGWSLPYHFDIGTGDSDLTWQANAGVAYRWDRAEVALTPTATWPGTSAAAASTTSPSAARSSPQAGASEPLRFGAAGPGDRPADIPDIEVRRRCGLRLDGATLGAENQPPSPPRPTRLPLAASPIPPQEPPDLAERIALTLADQGWCVTDGFLEPLLVSQLRHEAEQAWRSGDFRPAGVGRGPDLELRPDVRTDRVQWLDPAALSGAQQQYWQAMERVRLAVNLSMFLGLHELEAHFAVYPPGTYYRKHLDQFRGLGQRQLTCVLYLNDGWCLEDGGALRIYNDPSDARLFVEVLPVGGRLVTFLSARFIHEVRPSGRERYSLTGWLKRRP